MTHHTTTAHCSDTRWILRASIPMKAMKAPGNTTHGNGWIVQVLPTRRASRPLLGIPPTAVGGIPGKQRSAFVCRLGLNDPLTAVSGIPALKFSVISACRADAHPPVSRTQALAHRNMAGALVAV